MQIGALHFKAAGFACGIRAESPRTSQLQPIVGTQRPRLFEKTAAAEGCNLLTVNEPCARCNNTVTLTFCRYTFIYFSNLESLNAVEEKQKQKLASTQNVLKIFSSSLF